MAVPTLPELSDQFPRRKPRLSFLGVGIVTAVTVGAYILMAVVSIGQSDQNSADPFFMSIGAAIGLPIVGIVSFLIGLITAKLVQLLRLRHQMILVAVGGTIVSVALLAFATKDIIQDTHNRIQVKKLNCGSDKYARLCQSGPCCCPKGTICN